MSIDTSACTDIDKWHEVLADLYSQIESWLGTMEGRPHVERHPISLNERRSGPYEVEELIVTYNGSRIKVRPVARWVVGADGRVDLKGTAGPFVLIFQELTGWFWFPDDPLREPVPLNREVFLSLARTCLL